MNPPKSSGGPIRMPEPELESMLARAAEQGAKRALADVGLEGKDAALDIRDLRSLLECLRLVTTGILLGLIAGLANRLKLFGNGS